MAQMGLRDWDNWKPSVGDADEESTLDKKESQGILWVI